MKLKSLTHQFGAEVHGADLANLSPGEFAEIEDAFARHLVLCFREQSLTPEQLKAFAARFGELDIAPFVKPMEGHPEILEIVKEADDRVNFGGGWHSDFSFKTRPPAGTILQAIEVPPSGGDTLFSNQCLAYETLSAGMREMLDGLNAVHSPVRSYSHDAVARKPRLGMTVVADDSAYERHVHPLIRVHPVTGRRSLFCNPTYTVGIEGWTEVESAPLLEQLNRHATRPELTCRVQWAPGTVTMWDNRCCQHNALNDYHGHRRHMRRATVVGEVPLAA